MISNPPFACPTSCVVACKLPIAQVFETLWGILATVLPAGARDNCVLCKDAAALEVSVCACVRVLRVLRVLPHQCD
jgi:hypothetical protein